MSFVVANRNFSSVEQLESLVILLATQYRRAEPCEDFDGVPVSDGDYDEMYATLKKLNSKSKAFEGTDPGEDAPRGKIVIHDPPMTSIAKADGDDKQKKYDAWITECRNALGGTSVEFVQSWKRDGNAVRANYKRGKLVSVGTRPQGGIEGTDVTGHAKYIKGVPQKLALPLTLSLNFEVECWKEDFQAINAERDAAGLEPYANSRNYVAGQMGRDDPEDMKNSRLRATFHSISGFDEADQYYTTEIECAKWANGKDGLNLGCYVQVQPHRFEDLAKMEAEAPSLPYDVDGIVLKVNDIGLQQYMGHHGDNPVKEPRGAIAWKFAEKTAIATNDHLEWNTSRTGRVVPTAVFVESVELAETNVSRATCNNFKWAKDRKIGKGTRLEIKKAGKIIPNVVKVVDGEVKKFVYPEKCPVCKGSLTIKTSKSGSEDLMCLNDDCPAKHVEGWVFYFQNLGCKGLGASAMEKILASGEVHDLYDFYNLSHSQLEKVGFSKREALLAIATIWMVDPKGKDDHELFADILGAKGHQLPVQGWKFFAALGIPQVGKTAGKSLLEHFGTMEKIMAASEDELTEVSGIGPISAESICTYFAKNRRMVKDLLLRVELQLPKQGSLNGKTFVVTGSVEEGRDALHEQIEQHGGKWSKSVSRTTDYLVTGDNVGKKKTDDAAKLGVKVITVEQLKAMF